MIREIDMLNVLFSVTSQNNLLKRDVDWKVQLTVFEASSGGVEMQ